MATYPRLSCAECGREVSSVYAEPGAVHSLFDGRRYYYLRKHKTPDCTKWCPVDSLILNVVPIGTKQRRSSG